MISDNKVRISNHVGNSIKVKAQSSKKIVINWKNIINLDNSKLEPGRRSSLIEKIPHEQQKSSPTPK